MRPRSAVSTVCMLAHGLARATARPRTPMRWPRRSGTTQSAETDRKQISNARAVLRDPESCARVARTTLRHAIARARSHHRDYCAEPGTCAEAHRAATKRSCAALTTCSTPSSRSSGLTENINAGRKNGYLTPAVLREFVESCALYADAIEEIAASRGLTDEALGRVDRESRTDGTQRRTGRSGARELAKSSTRSPRSSCIEELGCGRAPSSACDSGQVAISTVPRTAKRWSCVATASIRCQSR